MVIELVISDEEFFDGFFRVGLLYFTCNVN